MIPQLPLNLDQIKGGVHAALINLLKGFINKPIKIRVVSFSTETSQIKIVKFSTNSDIYQIPEGNFPFHSFNYLFYGNHILRNQINDFNPDIIHYETGNSFLFTRLLGFKDKIFLQTIHGMSLKEFKNKKIFKDKITWYFNGVVQKLLYQKNTIHLSNYSKKIDKHYLSKNKNYTIIPNPIPNIFFNIPVKLISTNTILYIGVIDRNKNILFLLQTLNNLIKKNFIFHLQVLGDFNDHLYKKEISLYVNENNLSSFIHFNGWVSQSKMIEKIQLSDILVVSSKHESLPMAIAECMSAGRVVIASSVGGISEMINHEENGFLFDLKDPYLLYSILKDLYNNSYKLYSIGKNAKVSAMSKYNSDLVTNKTIAFYNKCLSSK